MLALYLSMLESAEDQEDFAALYERCKGRALHVAMKYLRDRALAEDAVHEGFLYLATHYQRLKRDYPQGLEGYFFQCVESRAINILHQQARESNISEEEWMTVESPEIGPERQATAVDQLERAIAAMNKLPMIYRMTLELHCTGWRIPEIAEVTGVSTEAAQKRLERARKMVRREVGEKSV